MLDVLLRALAGWLALSCVSVAGWSVLVTRYKRAMERRSAELKQFPAQAKRKAA
jgi:hypothetical protein